MRDERVKAYQREWKREWRKNNPEKAKEKWRADYARNAEKRRAEARVRYERNSEKINQRSKEWRKNNPEKVKEIYRRSARPAALKRLYGLTVQDFSRMEVEQKGCCAICFQPRKLVVDHCHKTGKVRALLCYACNSALGSFQDSIQILENAQNYLRKNKEIV